MKIIINFSIACFILVSGVASAASAVTHRFVEPIQWRTSGKGVAYPDADDPTLKLPLIDQLAAACIRFHESRNHLVDGLYSQGWYQFTISTWDGIRRLAPYLHLPPTPNQATGDEQSSAFVFEFKRNGRFGVQWSADAAYCPGTFFFG